MDPQVETEMTEESTEVGDASSLDRAAMSSPYWFKAKSPGSYVHARNQTQSTLSETVNDTTFRRTLMPVNIKQINDGWQGRKHKSMFINNSMVSSIKVIGQVYAKKTDEYKGSFKIIDCSGAINASMWFTIGRAELDCVPDGAYAAIVGRLNMEGLTPEIHCYSCKAVTNFNDITHHHLSVIATHIDLVFKPEKTVHDRVHEMWQKDCEREWKEAHAKTKQVCTKLSTNDLNRNSATFGKIDKIIPRGPNSNSHPREPTAEEVITFLRLEKTNFGPEGLHIGYISAELMATKKIIRNLLDNLVMDGEAYTTVDEDHYAPS